MKKKFDASIIMVDGSFRENFHSVDFFSHQTLAPEDYELIWVEYYKQVHPELENKISRYPNARIVKLGKEGEYHSSYCFNAGIKESRGEILFVPDADVVVEGNFLEKALKEHETNSRLALYFYRKDESQTYHTDDIDLNHLKQVCALKSSNNFGGCLSVKKKWLLEINGYDQHPVFGSGFHANGLDVYTRLKNLGLHIMWHPDLFLYHPWHPLSRVTASNYKLQHLIIQHHALNLETSAFQGIDSSKNLKISDELIKKLQRKQRVNLIGVFKEKLMQLSGK
ncbi:MAG: glycosyltransferase [Desulfobacteraceae bacterium]|nr:glycosyltransferase family 2 protein [Desulfobacteraceae bacterium]MBC2756759.1 glycosyltransferase [Desulfobacteraceae bacterium]